ncbi:MAG: alpha/beta fold hydrolase [Candidatus Odinarchaeota archaeon]|nr:alpha/beta fold hydrolase [Candidatus Odinarchaeota archaeon]
MEESCETFYFKKSEDIGVLLIHGFTGSPGEMRPLGEYLADKGITVKGILLPGHCTSPEDLATKKWQDWASAVEEGYKSLQQDGIKKIFVCGLSLGGALTLYFGETHSDVAGLIPLSAPVKLTDKRLIFLPLLKLFKKYMAKDRSREEENKIYELPHFSYDVFPLSALSEVIKLVKIVYANLEKITAPTLVIQSKVDEVVPAFNGELIHKKISSQIKKIVWLEKSHHVITLDVERETVYTEVEQFVKSI